MRELDMMRAGAFCLQQLEVEGISVRELEDVSAIEEIASGSGETYFTRMLSTQFNDLTTSNSFWLILEKEGSVVGTLGARIDEVHSDLNKFWANQQSRLYGGGKKTIDLSHQPPVVAQMIGRLAYYGDLYLERQLRIDSTAFVLLAYYTAISKWKPDWHYAFINDHDASRAQLYRLRMTRAYPGVHRWMNVVPLRAQTDWLIAMNDADLRYVLDDYLRRSEQPGVAENKSLSVGSIDGEEEPIVLHSHSGAGG